MTDLQPWTENKLHITLCSENISHFNLNVELISYYVLKYLGIISWCTTLSLDYDLTPLSRCFVDLDN